MRAVVVRVRGVPPPFRSRFVQLTRCVLFTRYERQQAQRAREQEAAAAAAAAAARAEEEQRKGGEAPPLLVLANKQDLPNAKPVSEITEALGLHKLRNRQWYIQATCAVTGDGLYEGLDWLSNQ